MASQLPLNLSEYDTKRQVARWLAREVMGIITMALILFLAAGRVEWIAGWAFSHLNSAVGCCYRACGHPSLSGTAR